MSALLPKAENAEPSNTPHVIYVRFMFSIGMKRKVNQDSRKHHLFPNFSEVLVHLLPKAELLNEEVFDSLRHARTMLARWRHDYNPAS